MWWLPFRVLVPALTANVLVTFDIIPPGTVSTFPYLANGSLIDDIYFYP